MSQHRPAYSARTIFILIALIVIGRAALSTFLPVMEFSEARYAEIARQILVTGDWVTLWFDRDVPFWGKPPLAFWSIATSYVLFGANEFAARLPSLLYTIATGMLLFCWCDLRLSRQTAVAASIFYGTSIVVLQTAGSVITDPLLTLTTTATMIGLWEAITHRNHRAAYLMWVALALGMLAKGPVAIALCGLAGGVWVLLFRQWRNLFTYGHLVSGLLLMLVIAGPWYYLAEARTPGFLNYFIIGEHFERYVQTEWPGDPYGAVKDRPFGTIWPYFFLAALPWSVLLIYAAAEKNLRSAALLAFDNKAPLVSYLAIWTLAPLIFFTPAKNVLITYVLPSIVPFAILLSIGLVRSRGVAVIAAATTTFFFVVSAGLYFAYFDNHRYNQRPIIDKYRQYNELDPGVLIYTGKRRFSPVFYTQGDVLFENTDTRHGMPDETFYIAVRDLWLKQQSRRLTPRCRPLLARNEFTLFYCPATSADAP